MGISPRAIRRERTPAEEDGEVDREDDEDDRRGVHGRTVARLLWLHQMTFGAVVDDPMGRSPVRRRLTA